MLRKRWAVFVSGTGSNLNALLDCEMFLDVALVVSSNASAYGLQRARRRGIPVRILEKDGWEGLHFILKQCLIDYIFLAGFMKIVPANFIQMWEKKIFNIHPSLLPVYPGLNSIARAYADGAPQGVTIHEVIPEVDAGAQIICKRANSGPNLDSTELLVHIEEHRCVRKIFEWHKKRA